MISLDFPVLKQKNKPISIDITKRSTERRKLVKLELSFLAQIRVKWERILADSTTDRPEAERTIRNCYAYAGLGRPRILWAENPLIAISILVNRPDLKDVASIILSRIWDGCNQEIESKIDPEFIQIVMADANPRAQIVGGSPTISFDPLGDYLNRVSIAKILQVCPLLDPESLPAALQDHRVAYLSYFDYFQEIGINIPQIDLLIDLAKSCGCCWAFDDLAIVTPKPTEILFQTGSAQEFGNCGELRALIYDGENILD